MRTAQIKIFFFNSFCAFVYARCILGGLKYQDLVGNLSDFINIDSQIAYKLILEGQSNSLLDILNNLRHGSNILIYQILSFFISLNNIPLAIIINSTIVSWLASKTNAKIYLLLSPYLIVASIGFNKEIFLILSLYYYLDYLHNKSSLSLLISFFVTLFSRIYFLIIIFMHSLLKKIGLKLIYMFYLVLALASGLLVNNVEFITSLEYVFLNKSNSLSASILHELKIDFLNTLAYPILNLFKIIYEPLNYLIKFESFYSFLQGYTFLIFIFNFKTIKQLNYSQKNFLVIAFLLISLIPFVHFRYLIPFIISALLTKNINKTQCLKPN